MDAVAWLNAQTKQKKEILVEGANALMLDIDYGTYPYVTSSSASIGGAFTGLAVSPFSIKKIIGVAKAYLSRVGNGPMPTEKLDVCKPDQSTSIDFLSDDYRKSANTSKPKDAKSESPQAVNAAADGWI